MCADVLTTWGVALEVPADAGGESSVGRERALFAMARQAYFDRCPRLAEFLLLENAVLAVSAEQVAPLPGHGPPEPLLVAASVIEVRQSSFEMALRIRLPASEDGDSVAVNGRCTMTATSATGETLPIPRAVRDEFIAIQLGSRDYC